MRVLFISSLDDPHARTVADALAASRHECLFWDPSDFENSNARVDVADGCARVSVTVTGLDGARRTISDFARADVLFIRRLPPLQAAHVEPAHAANYQRNGRAHTHGILHALCERMTPVCSLKDIAKLESKPIQLMIAAECGFALPRTSVSNDPAALRAMFPASSEAGLVAKPLRNLDWQDAHGDKAALPVTRVELDALEDQAIRAFPMVFQTEIAKQFEVRLVWLSGSYIAVRYQLRQAPTYVDSRSYRADEYAYATVALPDAVAASCAAYCERFDTHFAVFDFVVDEAGTWIFLESNAFGNFLGLQDYIEPRFTDLFVRHIPQLPLEAGR